jgi:phosphate transport system protein
MIQTYENDLETVNNSMSDLIKSLLDANMIVYEGLKNCDKSILDSAKEGIANMGSKTVELDNMIVKTLALHSPEAKDLRMLVSTFKVTNELVRAASNTRSFIKGFSDYCNDVDQEAIKEYAVPLQKSTVDALQGIYDMMQTSSEEEIQELFNKVLISESKTDDLYELLQESIFKHAKEIEDFDRFTRILSGLRKSEKIADRALEIANLLLFSKVGGYIGLVD